MHKTKVIWEPAKLPQLGIVFLIGLAIWFCPHPDTLDPRGWHLLAIFIATVAGIVLRPLPMGAVALLGVTATVFTNTLPLDHALSGFGNEQIWLIVIACFIARGFIKTGLGRRISYIFIEIFGGSSLGLAYGFLLSDLIMAPAIPSSTARAGGIILPVLKSLSETMGSRPEDGSARRIGAYLTTVNFHGTVITTTMFLTAGAANPIITKLASAHGVEITWGLWALAASVPAVLCLLLIPLVTYLVYPPHLKKTSFAAAHAKEKLHEMGPLTKPEVLMSIAFVLLVGLWVFGGQLSIHPTSTAILGLCFLLVVGVLNWKDILAEEVAWDSLIWFSVLVMMATNLNKLGVIHWFGDGIVSQVAGMQWHHALAILILVYFYIHYFFASVTAHVSALFAPFLAVAISVGTPPLLAALALGFFGTLCGGLTHYGMGQAPILYSTGYVDLKSWWKMGIILCTMYLIIWAVAGGLWWKWLGIW